MCLNFFSSRRKRTISSSSILGIVFRTLSSHPFFFASNSCSISHPRLSSPGSRPINLLAATLGACILTLTRLESKVLGFKESDDDEKGSVNNLHHNQVDPLICRFWEERLQWEHETYFD